MTKTRNPWEGLRPGPPPTLLRERVLAAARSATTQPVPGFLSSLYYDRVLRLCAVALAMLLVANVIVAGRGRAPHVERVPAESVEGTRIPDDTGMTAAEQLDELAPVLGDAVGRNRG